jgi:hypothetical protein
MADNGAYLPSYKTPKPAIVCWGQSGNLYYLPVQGKMEELGVSTGTPINQSAQAPFD